MYSYTYDFSTMYSLFWVTNQKYLNYFLLYVCNYIAFDKKYAITSKLSLSIFSSRDNILFPVKFLNTAVTHYQHIYKKKLEHVHNHTDVIYNSLCGSICLAMICTYVCCIKSVVWCVLYIICAVSDATSKMTWLESSRRCSTSRHLCLRYQ